MAGRIIKVKKMKETNEIEQIEEYYKDRRYMSKYLMPYGKK